MSTLLWAGDEGGACLISLADTTRPVAPRYLPVPSTTCPGLPSMTSIDDPNAMWLTQFGGPAATNVQCRWSLPLRFFACLRWLPTKSSKTRSRTSPGVGSAIGSFSSTVPSGLLSRIDTAFSKIRSVLALPPAAWPEDANGRATQEASGYQAAHARRSRCEAPHR